MPADETNQGWPHRQAAKPAAGVYLRGLSQISEQNYAPYRALWSAVLVAAIRDMDGRDPDERRKAREYIFNLSTKPTSMRWVCEVLGLDAEAVQAACMNRENRMKLAEKKATRGKTR